MLHSCEYPVRFYMPTMKRDNSKMEILWKKNFSRYNLIDEIRNCESKKKFFNEVLLITCSFYFIISEMINIVKQKWFEIIGKLHNKELKNDGYT